MTPELQALMHASFFRRTGRHLREVAGGDDLYHAPAIVLMHGTQADPIFCFANLAAQKQWGYTWAEFVTLPSRFSIEPDGQAAREHLLARARAHGFIDDYSGVRIARDGRRFHIREVILWNVDDDNGVACGQAAVFQPPG
jgi:PAS domain-containing protein